MKNEEKPFRMTEMTVAGGRCFLLDNIKKMNKKNYICPL